MGFVLAWDRGKLGVHYQVGKRRAGMTIQKGWMEQRSHERISATLKVSYRVLNEQEKNGALDLPRYNQTKAEHLPSLSAKFHVYHAVTRDISEGGFSVMGEQPFTQGQQVEVSIVLPQYNVPITFLTEVMRAGTYFELGKTMYNAGVRILALNREDMDRLMKFVLSQKLRQQVTKQN
jgi:hypothetical protein